MKDRNYVFNLRQSTEIKTNVLKPYKVHSKAYSFEI